MAYLKKVIFFLFAFWLLSFFQASPALAQICCPDAKVCVGSRLDCNPTCRMDSACCTSCENPTGQSIGQIGGDPDEGFGPWGNVGLAGTDIVTAAGYFTKIITNIITVITILAGLYFIFQFFMAAFTYLTAAGDSKKISSASSKISSAIIGILAVVASYAIISLLGSMLGFDILNPQNIITNLKP